MKSPPNTFEKPLTRVSLELGIHRGRVRASLGRQTSFGATSVLAISGDGWVVGVVWFDPPFGWSSS